ncbi:MAG: hypothetical protein QXH24_07260 [Candidatus Bathyarchaeia archaeon]
MPSIEMLTINEADKDVTEILEIIWRALKYFPKNVWDEVKYIGNANMKYDVKVKIKGLLYEAFLFNSLLSKIRMIRWTMDIKDLLLAVTVDPVIAIYSRIGYRGINRTTSLVHDYVSSDIGMISLFAVKNDVAVMITAHGLGHNRGLRHHNKPIDLMYEGLLEGKSLNKDGFCEACLKRIIKNG